MNMEITTKIDNKRGIRIHTVSGCLSKDELFSGLNEIYSRPDFQSNMNVLWDLRNADSKSVVMSDVVKTRDFVEQQWDENATIRIAFVVKTEMDLTLSAMFETLLQGKIKFQTKSFREMEESIDWLCN